MDMILCEYLSSCFTSITIVSIFSCAPKSSQSNARSVVMMYVVDDLMSSHPLVYSKHKTS